MSERINYTIRMTTELREKLTAKSRELKMTVGKTIEYLLEQQQKQIDYFDYDELMKIAKELEKRVSKAEREIRKAVKEVQ